jgi:hypothetical protein
MPENQKDYNHLLVTQASVASQLPVRLSIQLHDLGEKPGINF